MVDMGINLKFESELAVGAWGSNEQRFAGAQTYRVEAK